MNREGHYFNVATSIFNGFTQLYKSRGHEIEDQWDLRTGDVKTGMAPLEVGRMSLANPTYQSVDEFIRAAAALRSAGIDLPQSAGDILLQGKALLGVGA